MNQYNTPVATTVNNAFADLERIRQTNPIVHNITNLVTMQTMANLLLSIGASPIMAHARAELAEIAAMANALVINIGTLDDAWAQSIEQGQYEALKLAIPIIFDPVGVGASQYRNQVAKKILQDGVQVIRGNSSEIMALINDDINTKGVDAYHQSHEAIDAGKTISNKYQCTVVISGKTDVIIDQNSEASISYGTPLFTKVIGMGCAVTAMIAAFSAINRDYFQASLHAMTLFTLAGQISETKSQGPASFYSALVDTLFSLKKDDVYAIATDSHNHEN